MYIYYIYIIYIYGYSLYTEVCIYMLLLMLLVLTVQCLQMIWDCLFNPAYYHRKIIFDCNKKKERVERAVKALNIQKHNYLWCSEKPLLLRLLSHFSW